VQDFTIFSQVYFLLQEKDVDMHMTKKNLNEYNKVNELAIADVIKATQWSEDLELIDRELNIHIHN